ncbi:hypothetical protein WH5701_07989 [Synechococcus sp. WH 5701]|nr:hypothetical protein WH5701_07989 [Synechococcus sp. WH 5701]
MWRLPSAAAAPLHRQTTHHSAQAGDAAHQ